MEKESWSYPPPPSWFVPEIKQNADASTNVSFAILSQVMNYLYHWPSFRRAILGSLTELPTLPADSRSNSISLPGSWEQYDYALRQRQCQRSRDLFDAIRHLFQSHLHPLSFNYSCKYDWRCSLNKSFKVSFFIFILFFYNCILVCRGLCTNYINLANMMIEYDL